MLGLTPLYTTRAFGCTFRSLCSSAPHEFWTQWRGHRTWAQVFYYRFSFTDLATYLDDLYAGYYLPTHIYLLSLWWSREHYGLVELCLGLVLHLAVWVELPQLEVVYEGDVVGGMPVQAVAVHVEWHRVDQVVDGGHHLPAHKWVVMIVCPAGNWMVEYCIGLTLNCIGGDLGKTLNGCHMMTQC